MFSRKKDKTPKPVIQQEAAKPVPKKGGSGIPSIVSSDMRVLGNIFSEGMVDIDGIIEGNVKCHTITVRKNGHIKGDVIAESVHVYGKIQGLIKARGVHFYKGCRAEGVITHESITIEDGAFVDGRFKRTEHVDLDEDDGAQNSKKPLSSEAAAFDDSAFSAPNFLSEEKNAEATDTKTEKPAKGKKQESVLDNLRLISDIP